MQAFAVKVHQLLLILKESFHQIITNHSKEEGMMQSDNSIFFRKTKRCCVERSSNYTGF